VASTYTGNPLYNNAAWSNNPGIISNADADAAAWTQLGFAASEIGGEFVGPLLRFAGKGTITLAAKFALSQAVENPILTQAEERAMLNIPKELL
jgi:hypothetical protein